MKLKTVFIAHAVVEVIFGQVKTEAGIFQRRRFRPWNHETADAFAQYKAASLAIALVGDGVAPRPPCR